jgi:hypothetical protein
VAISRAFIDLTLLRSSRAFRRVWIGWSCSSFSAQMTLIAVIFQVWQTTHSTVWTGAVGIAQAIPMVVLGLLAGGPGNRRTVYLVALVG